MVYNYDSFFWFELQEVDCKPQVFGPYLTMTDAAKVLKAYSERIKGRL